MKVDDRMHILYSATDLQKIFKKYNEYIVYGCQSQIIT